MADPSAPPDGPAHARAPARTRPPGVRAPVLLAALTNTIAFFTAMNAAGGLFSLGHESPADGPSPFFVALGRAVWQFDQDHRRAMVPLYSARVVLAGLLFVASTRVVLRLPGAGRLWRQALLAASLCAGSTIVAEHAFAPARAAVVRVQLRTLPSLPSFMRALPLDEAARSLSAGNSFSAWLALGVLSGVLLYASRARTRAITG